MCSSRSMNCDCCVSPACIHDTICSLLTFSPPAPHLQHRTSCEEVPLLEGQAAQAVTKHCTRSHQQQVVWACQVSICATIGRCNVKS
jgi:hypothetical protein